MPEDYKMILYLFLGIFNEKYSIKQIAKFLRISEEEVSLKVDTGMTFIKNVINNILVIKELLFFFFVFFNNTNVHIIVIKIIIKFIFFIFIT